jgi:lipopolysaccharide biosynthesis glycosyltransferase
MNSLVFATALDRNYVLPYSVMLISFRDKNRTAKARAYVLHYDLGQDDATFLKRLAAETDIEIILRRIPAHPVLTYSVRKRRHINSTEKMSPIAYAKAFLDRYLPDDLSAVICIDADIVINGEMVELPKLNEGSGLAAVANLPRNHHHQFNSGFMLLDLENWRRIGVSSISERFLEKYSDCLHTHDQHTLNLIFSGRWNRLNLKWNYMEDFHRFASSSRTYSLAEIEEARLNPVVIHYAVGTDKPWRRRSRHPRADLYKGFLRKTEKLRADLKLIAPGDED